MTEKPRILVADDEPNLRRILQILLEQEGFEVYMAEDGQQAWDALRQFNPDLVLLDAMMPKMDGFEVLDKIRADFETCQLPVVILTAKGEGADKVKGLKGGANDYVIKPFDQEELLLRITNILAASREQREANPLTGLPGNRAIEREIEARIRTGKHFGFMYVDIDRFKSYNDCYGYSRGDQAISFLAGVLIGCSRKYGSGRDFVGHVGGDDFVLITEPDYSGDLARRVIEEFAAGVASLHDPEDVSRGHLKVQSRTGKIECIPLITLTVALVENARDRFEHPGQVSGTIAELKRYGKSLMYSVVVRERRSPTGESELVVTGVSGNEAKYSDATLPPSS